MFGTKDWKNYYLRYFCLSRCSTRIREPSNGYKYNFILGGFAPISAKIALKQLSLCTKTYMCISERKYLGDQKLFSVKIAQMHEPHPTLKYFKFYCQIERCLSIRIVTLSIFLLTTFGRGGSIDKIVCNIEVTQISAYGEIALRVVRSRRLSNAINYTITSCLQC
jgi:hypothetical protein